MVDEAYHEFHGETAAHLVDDHPNIVVLRTMAKAFGLAGLRIGYAIAHPETASLLMRVKAPFNVNYLAHEAAIAALKDTEYMRSTVEKVIADRLVVFKTLSKRFRTIPSSTNFIMFDVSPMSCDEFYSKMLAAGIVIRKLPPLEGFKGNWVRVTIGTTSECEVLVQALCRLSDYRFI